MEDVDLIKKRIYSRKQNKLTDRHFKYFFNFHLKIMVLVLIGLGVVTYQKLNLNFESINRFLSESIQIKWLDKYFNPFYEEDETVSATLAYTNMEGNYFTGSTNAVSVVEAGSVLYIGKQEILGDYVVVMGESGVTTTYGCLNDITCGKDDYLDAGTTIGTYLDDFMMIFEYQGSEITYEQAQAFF